MAKQATAEAPTQALALRLEDQLAQMDWNALGDAAPRIAPFGIFGWYHGNKAGKTAGAFYAKETEFAVYPAAPWASDDRFNDGPNPEVGFSASQLRIAFIGVRSQWFMPSDDDDREKRRKEWLTDYQPGAHKQVEYLCFVEGVDAPMILAGSKQTKTKPFAEILNQYRRGLLKQSGLRLRRPLPLWFHWLTIAGERGGDGKPVYTEAKDSTGKGYGSFVTLPKLYLPQGAIDTEFVGVELLNYGATLRREFAWWFEEVRLPGNTVEAEFEVVDDEPAPERRNLPKPIDVGSDEDLPF
jgi:hypothetical protein